MFQANRVRLARSYHSALELFKLGEEEISRSQNYEVKFLGDITDQLWPSRENRKRRDKRHMEISQINFGQVVKTEKGETSVIWRYHGSTCENRKRETSAIWRYHGSTCENRKRETSTIWRYHASTSLTNEA